MSSHRHILVYPLQAFVCMPGNALNLRCWSWLTMQLRAMLSSDGCWHLASTGLSFGTATIHPQQTRQQHLLYAMQQRPPVQTEAEMALQQIS